MSWDAMAERLEDTVESDALRQEQVLPNADGEALLRVMSRKSSRGEEIKWTEEVKRRKSRENGSAETIVGGKAAAEEGGEERGNNVRWIAID